MWSKECPEGGEFTGVARPVQTTIRRDGIECVYKIEGDDDEVGSPKSLRELQEAMDDHFGVKGEFKVLRSGGSSSSTSYPGRWNASWQPKGPRPNWLTPEPVNRDPLAN